MAGNGSVTRAILSMVDGTKNGTQIAAEVGTSQAMVRATAIRYGKAHLLRGTREWRAANGQPDPVKTATYAEVSPGSMWGKKPSLPAMTDTGAYLASDLGRYFREAKRVGMTEPEMARHLRVELHSIAFWIRRAG